MAADDFTLLPTWVIPLVPEYHNIETQSESMKKEYHNVSSTPVESFLLKYEGMSDANFKTLWDHYNGRYAGYDKFAWLNAYIPAYIKTLLGLTTEDLTGRWKKDTFKYKPEPKSWIAEIVFEKEVT